MRTEPARDGLPVSAGEFSRSGIEDESVCTCRTTEGSAGDPVGGQPHPGSSRPGLIRGVRETEVLPVPSRVGCRFLPVGVRGQGVWRYSADTAARHLRVSTVQGIGNRYC